VGWYAPHDEEIAQGLDYIRRFQLTSHLDHQTFSRELVDNAQHAECLFVVCVVSDEVIRPDVIGAFRAQTDARSVVEAETPAFMLLYWDFEFLSPPDPFDALLVHQPSDIRNIAAIRR
jgi:hypothetical protein